MTATRVDSGQVLGVTVNVCIDGVMSVFQSRMRDILDEHGIQRPDPHPDEWYPLDKFIRVLDVVETDVGKNAQRKIGEATPQFIDWPTNPDSPAEAFESLIDTFERTHRNVDSEYVFEQTDDSAARITSTTPYPVAWEKGLLKGTAEVHGATYARVNTIEDSNNTKVFEITW